MYAVLLLLGTGCACALAKSVEYYSPENAEIHFEKFIVKFDKKYDSEHEKEARLQIFKDNLENINNLNENSEHAVFGITKFTDLTSEEFRALFTCLGSDLKNHDEYLCDNVKLDKDIEDANASEAFDWRDHKVVTRVKNQVLCGSCWAFSATGHVEGQYARKYGKLVEFSEQQHIDCDSDNFGCKGGFMSAAFRDLKKLGGPMKEEDYPYTSGHDDKQHECKNDKSKIVVNALDCISYSLTIQEKVKQLLFKVGPLPIAINADSLSNYVGGILTDNQCHGHGDELDHGVLLVGYGTENGIPYWIVKNSWGKTFGEDGYFRMERNGSDQYGACGILNNFMATLNLK